MSEGDWVNFILWLRKTTLLRNQSTLLHDIMHARKVSTRVK